MSYKYYSMTLTASILVCLISIFVFNTSFSADLERWNLLSLIRIVPSLGWLSTKLLPCCTYTIGGHIFCLLVIKCIFKPSRKPYASLKFCISNLPTSEKAVLHSDSYYSRKINLTKSLEQLYPAACILSRYMW